MVNVKYIQCKHEKYLVESGRVRSLPHIFQLREHTVYMDHIRETQLAQLYDVFGFQRVIARYDVLSTLHETGPRMVTLSVRINKSIAHKTILQ